MHCVLAEFYMEEKSGKQQLSLGGRGGQSIGAGHLQLISA